jgi:zinc transporter ZupT
LREFLVWMEASALGHYMRESGPWTYAVVNLSHILGVATLFGSVLVLDLRLLGCWRRIPIATLASATIPVATVGFGIAALTGTALLATKATDYLNNPFFDIKFPAIALGLINVLILNLLPAWRARGKRELSRAEHRQLSVMGGISIACWLTAVSAGRMIGYW